MPVGYGGVPIPVADRRWWCPRHKDQAGPEDHLPPEPKYAIDFATMSVKALGPEQERLLEEDRKLVEKAREREERRRQEAEALAEVESRYVAQAKPISMGAGWFARTG
jgi:hypothetical protein